MQSCRSLNRDYDWQLEKKGDSSKALQQSINCFAHRSNLRLYQSIVWRHPKSVYLLLRLIDWLTAPINNTVQLALKRLTVEQSTAPQPNLNVTNTELYAAFAFVHNVLYITVLRDQLVTFIAGNHRGISSLAYRSLCLLTLAKQIVETQITESLM